MRWLPLRSPDDPWAMAQALFLENDYWARFGVGVQNAIARALGEK